jgi:outer membrane protein OmpA-like peptidoglycan-associated protein
MGRDRFTRDAFSRRSAPAAGLHAPVKDHFREKAQRLAARKGVNQGRDAFAPVLHAARKDAARAPFETPPAVNEPPVSPAPPRKFRMLANGASLQIVASQPKVVESETLKRDVKQIERRAAKSSTFVLVSSSTAIEPAPAGAVAGGGGQGELAIPTLSSAKFHPKRKTGGGGGGAGSGGTGSGGATPRNERIFNQDDLAGVLIVLSVLLLLGLYFFRANGGAVDDAADDDVLNVQSASTAPAAPPQPLPDPFGNQAVDLTPKSPPPPETAEMAAAPAPPPASAAAPAAAALEVRAHAYFCTDKSELTPASAEALEREIAAWGDRMAGKDLVVAGYADTRGVAVYNTWLGGERAKAVVNYLTAKGFKATAMAVGELPDLTDNENCANQRRVDVRLADAAQEAPSRSCAPPPELAALACLAEPPKKAPASSAPATEAETPAPGQ